jgi:hypothetical protein
LRSYTRLYDIDPAIVLDQADAVIQAQEQQTLSQMMQPPQQQPTATAEGGNPHNQQASLAAQANAPMPPS